MFWLTLFFRIRGEPCRDCNDLRTNACWLGQALPLVQSSPCFSAAFPPLPLPSSGVVGFCSPLVLVFQFLGLKTWWIPESQLRFAQSGFSPSSPMHMEGLVAAGYARRAWVEDVTPRELIRHLFKSEPIEVLNPCYLDMRSYCMIFSPVICLVCYSHRVRIWETVRT